MCSANTVLAVVACVTVYTFGALSVEATQLTDPRFFMQRTSSRVLAPPSNPEPPPATPAPAGLGFGRKFMMSGPFGRRPSVQEIAPAQSNWFAPLPENSETVDGDDSENGQNLDLGNESKYGGYKRMGYGSGGGEHGWMPGARPTGPKFQRTYANGKGQQTPTQRLNYSFLKLMG